jgi:hypothetical protein
MNLIPAAGGAEPVSKRVERFGSQLLSAVVARVIRWQSSLKGRFAGQKNLAKRHVNARRPQLEQLVRRQH